MSAGTRTDRSPTTASTRCTATTSFTAIACRTGTSRSSIRPRRCRRSSSRRCSSGSTTAASSRRSCSLCDLGLVLGVGAIAGRSAALLAALAPLALGSVVLSRFDLWPAALAVLAVAALVRDRLALSALLLGTAFAAKLWPAVARARRRRSGSCARTVRARPSRWLGGAVATAAAWFLPFVVLSPGGVGAQLSRAARAAAPAREPRRRDPARAAPRRRDDAPSDVELRLAEPDRPRHACSGDRDVDRRRACARRSSGSSLRAARRRSSAS